MAKSARNKQLHIRITEQRNNQLHELAKARGTTITSLVLSRLDDIPLKDYTHEKQFLPHLLALTSELHHIGNNINQATVALHHIKNGHSIPTNELETFNYLLKEYMNSREVLSKQLASIFFK